MAVKYLTVEHLHTKELTRLFSRITANNSLQWNGTPCWIWTGACNEKSYGKAWFRGALEYVHWIIYSWAVEPIPAGKADGELDHLCRRHACCNPIHTEHVTSKENLLRGNTLTAHNTTKTICNNGHLFSSENTYMWRGARYCKACRKHRSSEYEKVRPSRFRQRRAPLI